MKQRPDGKTCTFPKCDRAYLANGYCSGHNKQLKAGKKLKPLRKKLANNTLEDQCTVFECLMEAYAKGLCKSHYERARIKVKERLNTLEEKKEPESNG